MKKIFTLLAMMVFAITAVVGAIGLNADGLKKSLKGPAAPIAFDVVDPDVSETEVWNIYENEDYKLHIDIIKNLPLDPTRTYTLEDMDLSYSYIYNKNEVVIGDYGSKNWKKYEFTSISVKIGANNELEAVLEAKNGEDVISGTFVFTNPDPITVTLEGETEYIADIPAYAVSAKNIGSALKADYTVQFGIKGDAYESKTTFTIDDMMANGNSIRVATKETKITAANITLTVNGESQTYEGTVVGADGKTYAVNVTTNVPSKEAKKETVDFGSVLEVSEDDGDIKFVAQNDDAKFVGYITVDPVTTNVPSGEYSMLSYTKYGTNTEFGYMLDAVENGKVTVTNNEGKISIVATFKQNNVEYTVTAAVASNEISELIAGKTELTLKAGKEYTLDAVATLATDVVTINGNGATIKVGEAGKFSIQKGIVLNDVNLDASATSNAVLEFSATPDASLTTYTEEGGYKYANASWKGYEAEKIELNGCTFITNNSVIRPAAAWALRTLTIDNSIIEVKYKSGKAIINMEENGAGVIQNINIKNSTIYADDPATDMRFHRYAAQNDPWRVWGYEGEDKNVTKDYWTLENNTFVNVCGNKEFSNNMKNTNATEFTFKGNIFANTWRINKLGGNCKRNFVKEDNVICGGTNPVDGTDANWFTVDEELGIYVNEEGKNFVPDAFSIAAEMKYGDPRYLSSIGPKNDLAHFLKNAETIDLDPAVSYVLDVPANLVADKVVTINGNGATITYGAEGQIIAKAGVVLNNVKIDATASGKAPIALANKEALTAADTTAFASWKVVEVPTTYTKEEADFYNEENGLEEGDEGSVKEGDPKPGVAGTKDEFIFPNATNKVFIAELISITNSEIKTASSFVSGGNAPWALRTLNVDNSIVCTTTGSGKAFIDWEQGASQIKDIVIKNSTLYSTVEASAQRFHRYTAQVDPWRVWGYDGTDAGKNIPGQNTWVLTNNTIVNLCGNKEFSNNMKNTAATTFEFKGNIFANSWRMNKLGTNCTRLFAKEDNVICGGTNAVDGTDANWFTVDEEMGVTTANFMPNPTSYAFINKMGDPRWNWDYTFNLTAVIEANGRPEQKVENQKVAAKLNSTETVVAVYLPANELKNWKMASAILNIPCTFEGGVITMTDAVPAESVVFVNPASENVTATDVKVNGSIDTNGENATVEVKVNVPGIGAVTVTYNGVNTTDIKNVESAAAVKSVNAKFIENGRVVIVKNGAKFNVAGQVIK